ncbi:MAG: hypothetical protein Q9213_003939 [Squamulea squamosa]
MSDSLAQLSPSQLANLPAVSPPPGVRPNFDGTGPLVYTITTVASVFIALTFIFLGIRAYAKIKIHRQWSWDDGKLQPLLIPSHSIYANENAVTCTIGVVSLMRIDWLSNVAYIFVKLTLFILYWNIFHLFRWLKYGILGGATIVTGVHTAFTLYIIISDSPAPGQTWLEKAGASGNNGGIRLAIPLSAWSLVSDFYILLLPISGVLRLQLSPRRRLALLMVFMTGIG